VEIAQQLARLGVDVIEAGFPITSPGDFEAVEQIARNVDGPVICGLARTTRPTRLGLGAIKDRSGPHPTFISLRHPHRAPAANDALRTLRARPRRPSPWPSPTAMR